MQCRGTFTTGVPCWHPTPCVGVCTASEQESCQLVPIPSSAKGPPRRWAARGQHLSGHSLPCFWSIQALQARDLCATALSNNRLVTPSGAVCGGKSSALVVCEAHEARPV